MIEFNGIIKSIEKTEISKIDLISFEFKDGPNKMNLEMVKEKNPFKESDPVKIIFNTKPMTKNNLKLVLNGYLYSITKDKDINKIHITIGGLQLQIETSKEYKDFKPKTNVIISFF
ncbi:MAG: DNA-directed RNA polymerase subunit G [Promethearchaeota archaeon]